MTTTMESPVTTPTTTANDPQEVLRELQVRKNLQAKSREDDWRALRIAFRRGEVSADTLGSELQRLGKTESDLEAYLAIYQRRVELQSRIDAAEDAKRELAAITAREQEREARFEALRAELQPEVVRDELLKRECQNKTIGVIDAKAELKKTVSSAITEAMNDVRRELAENGQKHHELSQQQAKLVYKIDSNRDDAVGLARWQAELDDVKRRIKDLEVHREDMNHELACLECQSFEPESC